MNVSMQLADSAAAHPDGTYSLLRGGIDRLFVPPGNPAFFKGSMVVRLRASPHERGQHTARMSCVNSDGVQIGAEVEINFEIPNEGGGATLVINPGTPNAARTP